MDSVPLRDIDEQLAGCETEADRFSTAMRFLCVEVKRRRENNYVYASSLELNHSNRTRELVAALFDSQSAAELVDLKTASECLVELCDNLTQLEHALLLQQRDSSPQRQEEEEEEELPLQTACYILLDRVESALNISVRSGVVLCTLRRKNLHPFDTDNYVFWTARGAFELYENTLRYHEFEGSRHDRLLFKVRGNLVVSRCWDRSSRYLCVRLRERIGEPISDHIHIDTFKCTHTIVEPPTKLQSAICGENSCSPRCMSLRRVTEDRCKPLRDSLLGARHLFEEERAATTRRHQPAEEGENFLYHTALVLYTELPMSEVVCRQFGWPKPL